MEEHTMSIKKTVAIVAAAGALAAISVPAMAFENEFHGMFNGKFFLSNFDGANTSALGAAKQENYRTANYFEQRARVQYTAKASNDLKLVTHFELDSRFGGNGNTGYKGIIGGNDSGQLGADSLTLETKHVYLDFNAGSTNVKVGIQPYKDAFKGIYLDEDLSAIATKTKVGTATIGVAYARLDTKNTTTTTYEIYTKKGGYHTENITANATYNEQARDLFLLDTSFALGKDAKAGLSYYFDADYTTDSARLLHTLGLNAEAKMGILTASGFAAMQMGHQKAAGGSNQYHGYALNAALKAAVGPGTAKTSILFTSGDGNTSAADKHVTSWTSTNSSFNESGMMILNRNTADDGTTTDNSIAGATQNGTKGQILYTLGYDAKLGSKAYANFNAGMLWCAKSAGAPNSNAGDLMATEINAETGYKLYDNLTVKVQAAYAILGGYYKLAGNKDPENPYTFRTGLSYAF